MGENTNAEAGIEIHVDQERSRYELLSDGELASVADFADRDGTRTFPHTETMAGFEGRGLAGQLVRRALEDARDQGLEVLPLCPFVADYVGKHPEFADLVPGAERSRLGL